MIGHIHLMHPVRVMMAEGMSRRQTGLDGLKRQREPGQSYSDVIMRLALAG
jgi:hypothetical protein